MPLCRISGLVGGVRGRGIKNRGAGPSVMAFLKTPTVCALSVMWTGLRSLLFEREEHDSLYYMAILEAHVCP